MNKALANELKALRQRIDEIESEHIDHQEIPKGPTSRPNMAYTGDGINEDESPMKKKKSSAIKLAAAKLKRSMDK
jgi:hypothetical protein